MINNINENIWKNAQILKKIKFHHLIIKLNINKIEKIVNLFFNVIVKILINNKIKTDHKQVIKNKELK